MASPKGSLRPTTSRSRRSCFRIWPPPDHDGANPAGIDKKGFWQKDVSKGFPEWLERIEVPKKDGIVHHPLVTDTRSLLWVTNQNTITQHVWTSRAPNLYHPDVCVFDLDPSREDEPDMLRAAALAVRDFLDELGLPSWVKTSGSKGFHIVVPLDGKAGSATSRGSRTPLAPPRDARSGPPDAGVQQGRPRRPHPGRHRPQRLQRDVRRSLHRAREAWRARVCAVHVGGGRTRQGRSADVHLADDGQTHRERRRLMVRDGMLKSEVGSLKSDVKDRLKRLTPDP